MRGVASFHGYFLPLFAEQGIGDNPTIGLENASEHQVFLKLLSAVSMVFRSSGDMLGAAFFII
jgi:hypothetical protein